MGRRLDPAEAEQVMRAAGCIPLVPYPGNHVPWPCIHEPCGRTVTPMYSNVRRRGGEVCRDCGKWIRGAKRRAQLADGAVAAMRAAGFEPLEPYPGSDKPWRCRHEPCGQERTPALNTVRANGTACRECSAAAAGRRTWTAETAEATFRENGLTPLEPWPGSSSKPWQARHDTCGRTVTPRLGNVVAGQGPCRECGQEAAHDALRMDHDTAAELFLAAGLHPIAPFPGVDQPWLSRHDRCGAEVSPTYTNIKRGQGGCIACAAQDASERLRMPEEAAREIMARHHLHPVEPYPGSMRPWPSRHSCGRIVSPTLSNVSANKGICRYCHSAFPYDGPALLYLVVDRDAVKIGCSSPSGRRIADHERFGWKLAWTVDVPTGDDAYNMEQAMLAWWRTDLALPPAYTRDRLPQTGYTETAPWDEMHPAHALAKVDQLAADLGLPALPRRTTPFLSARPAEAVTGMGARARSRQPPPAQPPLFELTLPVGP